MERKSERQREGREGGSMRVRWRIIGKPQSYKEAQLVLWGISKETDRNDLGLRIAHLWTWL